jgi:DNA mismatch endonuclease (patch repair protein)
MVRSLLHRLGFRFRLHQKNLPGTPDIVLSKYKSVIFVHGCFWHGHECADFRRPKSRIDFWNKKIESNVARDLRNCVALKSLGWRTMVVWSCELGQPEALAKKLIEFLEAGPMRGVSIRTH